jgi:RsiW-degrading membrane proteinase PrsW (M82 family)
MAAELFGELRASQLAVIRTLDALTGHFAYSAYFAYYVGLGLLRPAQRWKLAAGGLVSAALLHGFFNAATSTLLQMVATVVAMLILVAVILNARKISPTREENFATISLSKARQRQTSA